MHICRDWLRADPQPGGLGLIGIMDAGRDGLGDIDVYVE